MALAWLEIAGLEQDVYTLHDSPPDLRDGLAERADWYGEGHFFRPGLSKFAGIVQAIRRVCQDRRPDAVVCWIAGMSSWVCAGARLGGCHRVLVHQGNPPGDSLKAGLMTAFVFQPLRWMGARVLCCSDYVRDQYRAAPLAPAALFETVYNCIPHRDVRRRADVARAARPPGSPPTVVMVATLEAHKDHRTLLEALAQTARTHPDARLRLAGDGSLRASLEGYARTLGVADRVEFLGTRSDVPELLGQADVFAFSTTRQEGLGIVLIEALAAGLPVVASDVPACREMLAGGALGTLVPAHDPAALAEAISAALLLRSSAPLFEGETFTPRAMAAAYLASVGLTLPAASAARGTREAHSGTLSTVQTP